jgi:hypothetical protein
MGESRGGEGGGRRPTTGDIARYVRQDLDRQGRVPRYIQVQPVTKQLYAVEIWESGGEPTESFFMSVTDS